MITKKKRITQLEGKKINQGKLEMPFKFTTFGKKPKEGWDLFISLHGGGATSAKVNNQQWQNQFKLAKSYKPINAIYVAPRAPTNTWNLWHEKHIDAFFDELIQTFVMFKVPFLGSSHNPCGNPERAARINQ